MKHHNLAPTLATVLLSLSLGAALTGCGGESKREAINNNVVPGYTYNPGTGTCTGSNCTTPYPTPTSTSTGSLPPLTYTFSLTGEGGSKPTYTTPPIQTDSILRVRLTAGPAGQLSASGVSYSNFSSTYNCISYTVGAVGQSANTSSLNVGASYSQLCPGAQSSQVLDFSGRLSAGHNAVQISVTSARYDFYCELLMKGWVYGTYSMFCPLHTVYKNHTVTGSLSIQVNGTSAP
jgi:hypothetical protein